MERAYTVKEIDELRAACEMRWLFGTTRIRSKGGCSRSYREEEKSKGVEELVRTYMLSGIVAADIYAADAETPNIAIQGSRSDPAGMEG